MTNHPYCHSPKYQEPQIWYWKRVFSDIALYSMTPSLRKAYEEWFLEVVGKYPENEVKWRVTKLHDRMTTEMVVTSRSADCIAELDLTDPFATDEHYNIDGVVTWCGQQPAGQRLPS